MKKEETIVMYDSPEAAQQVTVTAWKSKHGFVSMLEDVARYDGATHISCPDCGVSIRKDDRRCRPCDVKMEEEKYANMPFQEWNGLDALYSNRYEEYFFSDGSIVDFVNESAAEVTYDNLDLIICDENHMYSLEFPEDNMPEDQGPDDVLPKEIIAKLAELNELISSAPPISYSPGKYRTTYSPLSGRAPVGK